MRQSLQRVLARGLGRSLVPWVVLSVWLLSTGSGAAPQNPNPLEVQPQQGQSQEARPTFQLHVERNVVTVRVVVRDGNDRPVGNLRKEDFRLFDDGKPQEILGFTVETGNPSPAPEAAPAAPAEKAGESPRAPAKSLAQRFVILYFDDYHMEPEGITLTRNAAWRYVTTAVRPQDRVAIYTATGKDQIDFTEDREKLHDALFRLSPRPSNSSGCHEISAYEAYRVTIQEPQALALVHAEAVKCDCGITIPVSPSTTGEPSALLMEPPRGGADPCPPQAKQRVERDAAGVWEMANMQVEYALDGIENAVRRLAAMPGQRALVLVSPGFLTETQSARIDAITNRALQQDVVVSAIDALGLEARKMPHLFEVSPDLRFLKSRIENAGTVSAESVLASLSASTGGVFFHNSNDFNDGFRQAAAVPDVYYVLTFSPPNVKLDGKYHSLKVTLNNHELMTVQARRGYFASASGLAGQPSSQDELEKVVFSHEETHGLPAQVTAQVERVSDAESKLTVLIHVDVRQLQFRKEGDRSVDKLIFHTALFDDDGKYMTSKAGSIDLHLKGATLTKVSASGINAKTSFKVAPGTYRVREVVQDTESKTMSALNYDVQVPTTASRPEVPVKLAQKPKKSASMADWTLAELMSALPELEGLKLAENQQELPTLLQNIGENVKSFFDAFPNTTAREQITLELLDWKGQPVEHRKELFNYLDLALPAKNDVGLKEYRTDAKGHPAEPAPIGRGFVSKGFASMLVYFHPTHLSDTEFRDLGRQLMDGRETEVVLFSQIPGKAPPKETLHTSTRSIPILVQGLAWIDPTSYQIVRMRTDLLRPQGDMDLKKQTTESRFTEVDFKESPLVLWLPAEVTVTVVWRGQVYRNRHEYSDFKLFSVETPDRTKSAQRAPD
ncbi:MAG: VWA domain-containing protein [Terriglobia bacterium]|jgi:VWFA-related protein